MEYKDVVIDNDALVNTEPKELETEPSWIPQGKKPELNPNPGYGESGETKPALVTVPVKGEVEVDGGVFTPKKEGAKVVQDLVNFASGLLVGGKSIEELIPEPEPVESGTKLYKHHLNFTESTDISSIDIISNLSTPINNDNIVSQFASMKIGTLNSLNFSEGPLVIVDSTKYYYIDLDEGGRNFDRSTEDIFTDTVTEL